MTTISRNTVSFCIRKSSLFQKPLPIKVKRLQRRTNMLLVKCKFSKQALRSPKEEFDGSKTVLGSKIQVNKVITRNLRMCKDANKVLLIIEKNRNEMNCINVAAALVSIAYIVQQRSRRNNSYKLDIIRSIYLELFLLTELHVGQMQHQAVANSLWSIGKLVDTFGYQLIEEEKVLLTFNKLCDRMLCVVDKMSAQGISNSLWAMGKLKYRHSVYIKALVEVACKQSSMQPQDISNTLWALAVLQYGDVQIINRLVGFTKTCLTEMNGQDIANSVWALMQLRYYDKDFMDLVEQQLLNSKKQLRSQSIVNILLAFAEFGMCGKDNFVHHLLLKLTQNTRHNAQDYVNSIYALSVLGCPVVTVQNLVDLFTQKFLTQQINSLSEIDLRQLWRAQLYYQSLNQALILPTYLSDRCKRAGQEKLEFLVQLELPFLNTVYSLLQGKGYYCQKQALMLDGQLQVEILINNIYGDKIAVMTSGSTCYAINDEDMLLGRRKYIINIIRNFGYIVVHVSEPEWKKREDYKNDILEQVRKYL